MQSLESIKKRIHSVQTTAKITNAMKLVASAKIKKQKQIFLTTSNFCSEYYLLMRKILKDIKSFDFLVDSKKINHEAGRLLIVVTSSLGLCGAYNNNVCKLALSELGPNDKLAIFGKKGYSFFKARGYDNRIIFNTEVEISDSNFYGLLPYCYRIINSYSAGKFSKLKIVYTKFINSLHFEARIISVFPFNKKMFEARNDDTLNKVNPLTEFEPSKEKILKTILPLYLSTIVFGSVVESSLCENSSRKNTMDSATKNAEDLIDSLKLIYNQLRQESITQEINEIISGSNN